MARQPIKLGSGEVGDGVVGGLNTTESGPEHEVTSQRKRDVAAVQGTRHGFLEKIALKARAGIHWVNNAAFGQYKAFRTAITVGADDTGTPKPIIDFDEVQSVADTLNIPLITRQFTEVAGLIERKAHRTDQRVSEVVAPAHKALSRAGPALIETMAPVTSPNRFSVTKQLSPVLSPVERVGKGLLERGLTERMTGRVEEVSLRPGKNLIPLLAPKQETNFRVTHWVTQRIPMVEDTTPMPIIDFDEVMGLIDTIRQNPTKQLQPLIAPIDEPDFFVTKWVKQALPGVEKLRQGPIKLQREEVSPGQKVRQIPTKHLKETMGVIDFVYAFLQGVRRRVSRSQNNVNILTGTPTVSLSDLRNNLSVLNPFNDADVSDRRNDADVSDGSNET